MSLAAGTSAHSSSASPRRSWIRTSSWCGVGRKPLCTSSEWRSRRVPLPRRPMAPRRIVMETCCRQQAGFWKSAQVSQRGGGGITGSVGSQVQDALQRAPDGHWSTTLPLAESHCSPQPGLALTIPSPQRHGSVVEVVLVDGVVVVVDGTHRQSTHASPPGQGTPRMPSPGEPRSHCSKQPVAESTIPSPQTQLGSVVLVVVVVVTVMLVEVVEEDVAVVVVTVVELVGVVVVVVGGGPGMPCTTARSVLTTSAASPPKASAPAAIDRTPFGAQTCPVRRVRRERCARPPATRKRMSPGAGGCGLAGSGPTIVSWLSSRSPLTNTWAALPTRSCARLAIRSPQKT